MPKFLRLSGYLAWVLWGVAHIFFLIGFRNKITVTLNWMWQYLTFHGGMRLITGSTTASPPTARQGEEVA